MTPGQVVLTYLLGSYPMNIFLLWLITKHKEFGRMPDYEAAPMFWLSPITIILTLILITYCVYELITRCIQYILCK